MELENNITAFPSTPQDGAINNEGMTLLDYFAGKFIPQMGHDADARYIINNQLYSKDVAKAAYKIAAAMLEERKNHIQ